MQLYRFLMDYVESRGRICNCSVWSQGEATPADRQAAQMAQQSVLHELVRALAQLLADCGQHLDGMSRHTLAVLLPLCDPG